MGRNSWVGQFPSKRLYGRIYTSATPVCCVERQAADVKAKKVLPDAVVERDRDHAVRLIGEPDLEFLSKKKQTLFDFALFFSNTNKCGMRVWSERVFFLR
jgi:hypothetical protein